MFISKRIPDISEWNIENVENLSFLFYNCSSLKTLPDISKWNIKNVKDLNSLFEGCSSLKELPDISKWNIKNIKDLSNLFKGDYYSYHVENGEGYTFDLSHDGLYSGLCTRFFNR